MYKINNKESKKHTFLVSLIIIVVIFSVIAFIIWYFLFRNSGESITSFERVDNNVKINSPATQDFTTNEFTITLPEQWELLGKDKPYYNEEYYLFQSKVVNKEGRFLKVYINLIPENLAVNRMLPIVAQNNRIVAGDMSGDCKNFKDAPEVSSGQKWLTEWKDVPFYCALAGVTNQVGTGTSQIGYPTTVNGDKSGSNKYFFMYTDQTAKPDYSILKNAVNSFVAL